MTKQINFGEYLKTLRIQQQLTLREICRKTNYDYSNWSKVERGILSPPSDENILKKWADALGIESKNKVKEFIEFAQITQGIIPEDIMARSGSVAYLPAFFRTIRGQKPTKEEIDQLMRLIKGV